MKVVKRYKLPVIKSVSTGDVKYNMTNIMNTATCYTLKLLRVNPKSSHHKAEIFFCFFNFVSI